MIIKDPVRKDFIRTILFKTNWRLKCYIILSIIPALLIFKNYKIIDSFPNKYKPLPTKTRKLFLHGSEDNNGSILYVYFDI